MTPADDPIERYAKWGAWALPPTVLLIAIVGGVLQGAAFGALALAAGAMLAAIVAFWSSIRALFGETQLSGEDAFAMGAPSAEEEQKRAVLRAIKDVEFERSVGKISEGDYQLYMAKYRAEAKRLLRVLDDRHKPQRERVEGMVAQYLSRQGLAGAGTVATAEPDQPPMPAVEPEPAADDEVVVCPSCDSENDSDADFCKKCGKRMKQPDPAEDDA